MRGAKIDGVQLQTRKARDWWVARDSDRPGDNRFSEW
jgi:hypothetical protein